MGGDDDEFVVENPTHEHHEDHVHHETTHTATHDTHHPHNTVAGDAKHKKGLSEEGFLGKLVRL